MTIDGDKTSELFGDFEYLVRINTPKEIDDEDTFEFLFKVTIKA